MIPAFVIGVEDLFGGAWRFREDAGISQRALARAAGIEIGGGCAASSPLTFNVDEIECAYRFVEAGFPMPRDVAVGVGLIVLVLVLLGTLAGFYFSQCQENTCPSIQQFVQSFGSWAPLIFAILYIAASPIPKAPTMLTSGIAPYSKTVLTDGLAQVPKAGGVSPMGDALAAAEEDLGSLDGKTALVVISDGADMGMAPLAAAEDLVKSRGDTLCIQTVQVGDDPAGAALLEKIAAASSCGGFQNADAILTSEGMAGFVQNVFLGEKLDSDGDGMPDWFESTYDVGISAEDEDRCRETLSRFLAAGEDLLDAETISVLVERDLSPERIDAFIDEAEHRCASSVEVEDPALPSMCDFLASYGAAHPSRYRQLRGFFTRAVMIAPLEAGRELAQAGKMRLAAGFRAWLGAPSRVAVDQETGLEYRWEDVVEFSDEVDEEARERLLEVLDLLGNQLELVGLVRRGARQHPVDTRPVLPEKWHQLVPQQVAIIAQVVITRVFNPAQLVLMGVV